VGPQNDQPRASLLGEYRNHSARITFNQDRFGCSPARFEYLRHQHQIVIEIHSLLAHMRYFRLHFKRGLDQRECMGNEKIRTEVHRDRRSVKASVMRRR